MLTNTKSSVSKLRLESLLLSALGIVSVGVFSLLSIRRRISNCDSGITILLEDIRCYKVILESGRLERLIPNWLAIERYYLANRGSLVSVATVDNDDSTVRG